MTELTTAPDAALSDDDIIPVREGGAVGLKKTTIGALKTLISAALGGGGGGGGGTTVTTTPDEPKWTIPLLAEFTPLNLGTISLTDTPRGLALNCPAGNAFAARGFYKPVGAGPWDLYARYDARLHAAENNGRLGVILRNSANGRLIMFGQFNDGNGLRRANVTNWNNENSYSGETGLTNYMTNVGWIRIQNDGAGTLNFYIGDGYAWRLIYTTTVGAFIGAVDGIGFAIQSGFNSLISLNSFSLAVPSAVEAYPSPTSALLGSAWSNTGVTGVNSSATEDVPGLSVTFNMPTAGVVEIDWGLMIGRDSGNLRVVPFIDGVIHEVAPSVAWATVATGENGNQHSAGKFAYAFAAGDHTVKLVASAMFTTTSAIYRNRVLTVRRLS